MTSQTAAAPSHTPGPFYFYRHADGVDDRWVIASSTTDQEIAVITFWGDDEVWATRALADAHLLTTAPRLLDALQQLLAAANAIPEGLGLSLYQAEQLAHAAIAAAKGEC